MNVSISGIQFQYFESLFLWQEYEMDSDRDSLHSSEFFQCINKSLFNVIEELEIKFRLGQRKKEVALTIDKDKYAQFIVEGKVSDIKVNMTSERYNSLINFSKMIEITSNNFSSNIILHEKDQILKMAVKTGDIRKRGDTLEYWDAYFAVLSGSYLYFYNEDIENTDSYESWIYLKDTVITIDNTDEEDVNIFIISNRDTTLYLYVNDEREVKEWVKCIREKVFEIGSINDSFNNHESLSKSQKKRGSLQNLEDILEI